MINVNSVIETVAGLKMRMQNEHSFGSKMRAILSVGRRLDYDNKMSNFSSSSGAVFDPSEFATELLTAVYANDPVNLISSLGYGDMHYPVLDLDFESFVLPSRTPGHTHLFINYPLNKAQYDYLMTTLHEIGLIEKGYYESYKKRGVTSVRLPS
jgi:hypothetical protein